ncbi:hypothetical protein ERO13_D04G104233v2 [Gossypium hirsutum]|uniref:Uncharacterized protein n=1 Tax=Gossypium barbadense TaxID=3634 RepID=A0A5J5RZ22_GOSBA|nr:hypothetical protein ES319_D04G120200v1 [Gossypium barbadense]KAB2034979.1 hypothetical protein ES319_D04G120600v1 [Gossypium barbadense]KAG4152145.1 hypothetical protein ERO13_D04G104233v2 [Gossypium hirsutum]
MNPTTCISGLLYLALSGRFIIRNYTGKLKTLVRNIILENHTTKDYNYFNPVFTIFCCVEYELKTLNSMRGRR